MRYAVLLMLFLSVVATSSFAQQATTVAPVAGTVKNTSVMADKTLNGVVQTVSIADAAKGTKSEIAVADDKGVATMILVKATTTLYGADTKAISLDKIAAKDKVSVVYATTTEGVNEAKSVKVVK